MTTREIQPTTRAPLCKMSFQQELLVLYSTLNADDRPLNLLFLLNRIIALSNHNLIHPRPNRWIIFVSALDRWTKQLNSQFIGIPDGDNPTSNYRTSYLPYVDILFQTDSNPFFLVSMPVPAYQHTATN
jgi:hypothetical protein